MDPQVWILAGLATSLRTWTPTGRRSVGSGLVKSPQVDARLISFGLIEIDGRRFDRDVVLEAGTVRLRKKKPSKAYRDRYGHTPLSADEEIPWSAPRLIVGTGAGGQLPIMPELYREARRRGVEIVAVPTEEACRLLSEVGPREAAAVIHVTC
jgi:hypothetical protein